MLPCLVFLWLNLPPLEADRRWRRSWVSGRVTEVALGVLSELCVSVAIGSAAVMINRRSCRISNFFKMLSRLQPPWTSPVFPEKCTKFHYSSLSQWDKRFFYSSMSCAVAKISVSNRSSCPSPEARLSRAVKNDAQVALFDYLHSTRDLYFSDAEHISRNSPAFLQKILLKVEKEEDVQRSLRRYFRLHPINEFEPFFESLGLSQSQYLPLLPRNFMFLCDDEVMLENFHVLCNYGIPRSKIGKMFLEGSDMFNYDWGVLNSKLKAYEDLGLSKSAVIKLVTWCPSLLIGGVNQDFVGVLEELKGLDIEPYRIAECLSVKNTYYCWNRMLRMLTFLKEMGCSVVDLGRLIKESPGFFFDDSGNKIYMLVALLLKLGIKMKEILALLLQFPHILAGKFAENLWSAVHFLFDIGMETEDIMRIIQTHPQVLGSCSLNKPRVVLSRLKLGPADLSDLIKKDPCQLSTLASKSNRKVVREGGDDRLYRLEKIKFLLKLGFVENSEEMVQALKQFRGRGDQLQERFDCLVNAGLDYHLASSLVREAPPVLNQSRDVIEEKIYYLEDLGYPLQSVVAFPTYLCYDMERIKLRFSMLNWLKEKGVVKPTALSTILASPEARFVKYHVSLHPEGLKEWERLKKSLTPS